MPTKLVTPQDMNRLRDISLEFPLYCSYNAIVRINFSPTWRKRLYWLTWGLVILIALATAVTLWQWYDSGGGFEAVYVAIGVLLAGAWAANRTLARLPDEEQPDRPTLPLTYTNPNPQTLAQWRQQMNSLFNLSEIRGLAFELGADYDNLSGDTKDGKIVSLLTWAEQHARLPQLHASLKQLRPHTLWPNPGVQMAAHDERNRRNFLNLLQSTWIDGFLHQSLHREVLKLAMHYQPDAVPQRAWRMVLQQAGQSEQIIPPGQSIHEIFKRHGRSLLLLGDPGSGKTITMLQLAEELVALAQNDPTQPMPVVLNLSSWGKVRGELAAWMAEEMHVQYGVAREVGRRWIAENRLVYLLDGLDEVAADARDDCITAINAFKAAYPAEMLVCSRIKDYEALHNRLHLGTAIRIQPLTDAQVNAFLQQPGLAMQAVRAMLKTDPDLRELARSPLLLNVMALAYRGKTAAELGQLTTKAARRRHLFAAYVDAMFRRRPLPDNCPYTEADARRWLACLARGMANHNQSVFYIERLQPTWLPTAKQRNRYQLIAGLIVWLSGVLRGGLILGLLFGLFVELSLGLIVGLFYGLFVGLDIGLDIVLSSEEEIILVEELTWLPPRKLFSEIKDWLIVWLIGGLSVGLFVGLIGELSGGLFGGLIVGLFLGLFVGLIDGLQSGVHVQESRQLLAPNQGIRSSGRNALRMGLIFGLIFGLIGGLILELRGGLILGLSVGLIFGLIFGLMDYGGAAVIRHYALRWLLARANILPYPFSDKKLVAFLDAMKDRILLRRAGGGWLFIHRALLEHLAESAPNT